MHPLSIYTQKQFGQFYQSDKRPQSQLKAKSRQQVLHRIYTVNTVMRIRQFVKTQNAECNRYVTLGRLEWRLSAALLSVVQSAVHVQKNISNFESLSFVIRCWYFNILVVWVSVGKACAALQDYLLDFKFLFRHSDVLISWSVFSFINVQSR